MAREKILYGDGKTLDVHVYRLRKKFDAAAGLGHLLEKVVGMWFVLL
jgi:DNA-binding response OmpR family regulator